MTMDKHIHKYDFKFRSLLTNGCNYNCGFCLNDFQARTPVEYLDFNVFYSKIIEYITLSNIYRFEKQVYFSGGEPTTHPNFKEFLNIKRDFPDIKLILCTNGNFPDTLNNYLNEFVDEVHLSAYPWNFNILKEKANKLKNCKIQCVHSNEGNYVTEGFLKELYKLNVPIKIFSNFFDKDYTKYNQLQKYCGSVYGRNGVSFRFTGIQENRGIGCFDCSKKCVTLKGAWLFPDGVLTPCPQDKIPSSVIDCYSFHLIEE